MPSNTACAPPVHYRPHRDPRSSHQQIASVVRDLVGRGQTPVLDVGCAQGMLGQTLSNEAGRPIEIDGIEPNSTWADLARPHYRQVWATFVENAPLAPGAYRIVVCADVLEHVPDPAGVLTRLRAAARDDATFIVSVPNVAHLSVRLMLLFGRFPKMSRGILDRTHLHFFTKDTAADLLREAKLEPQQVMTTPVPLNELLKRDDGFIFCTLMKIQSLLVGLLPRMFTMQWIFVARPSGGITPTQ